MKILHLDYDDLENPYAGGGQAKATFEINRRLAKDNKIVVITGSYPGARDVQKLGIRYLRVGFGNYGAMISILSYWVFAPIKAWHMQKDFDIIIEFFTAPFSASMTPFILKKPVIACPTFFDARELSKKYKIPFYIVEELGVKKYKFFIALTNNVRDKILKLNPNAEVVVIPRGIEKEYFKIKGKEENYVLYLGRIDMYQKGLDLLLRSWKDVSKRYPKIKLIIAGGGKWSDERVLNNMINLYQIKNSVIQKGVVKGNSKIKLLTNSLCIVNPSRWETFGNSALESLAVGRPLICFDIDGYKWIPDSIVVKVQKFNTDSLSMGIMKILMSKTKGFTLGQKAKKFAKNFEWDKVTKEYLSTYISATVSGKYSGFNSVL